MGKIWQKLFLNQSNAWIAAFTLVLAVVAVFSYCNYKKTNEIFVSTQRAFVRFKNIQGANIMDSKGQKLLGLQFFVELENSGTTPTRSAFAQSNFQAWRTPLPKGFAFEDLTKTEKRISMSIGAKASALNGPLFVDIDTINDAIQKKSFLFFWGWIIYHDIFKGTPTRLTEFCCQLDPIRVTGNPDKTIIWTVSACVEHNCFDEDCSDYQTRIK
jgi:hypothetical protein